MEKDYNDAIKTIENYRKNKEKNYVEKPPLRKQLEIIGGSWAVPGANDLNGIEIIHKNNVRKCI